MNITIETSYLTNTLAYMSTFCDH